VEVWNCYSLLCGEKWGQYLLYLWVNFELMLQHTLPTAKFEQAIPEQCQLTAGDISQPMSVIFPCRRRLTANPIPAEHGTNGSGVLNKGREGYSYPPEYQGGHHDGTELYSAQSSTPTLEVGSTVAGLMTFLANFGHV